LFNSPVKQLLTKGLMLIYDENSVKHEGCIMKQIEYLTTKEFSEIIRRKGQTIRKTLCLNGGIHAYGIHPIKFNGQHLWPKEEVLKLLNPS